MSFQENMSDRVFLRFHLEAVWGIKIPPITQKQVALLPDSHIPPWKLSIAAIGNEHILIWQTGLDAQQRADLSTHIDRAMNFNPDAERIPGTEREIAFRQSGILERELIEAQTIARMLTTQDHMMIETFEQGSSAYYFRPECFPLIGVVKDERLLCIAHSARRTKEACELGIMTLPEARHQGYARAATLLWTQSILQEGLIPFYSTLAHNVPSLQLAVATGYRVFAHVATIA